MQSMLKPVLIHLLFFLQFNIIIPQVQDLSVNTFSSDSIITANIKIVGDLMCHSTQFKYAWVNADSFDFTGVYREVKKYLSDADLTIGNLETVTAGNSKKYSGYPFFNAPDDFIYALKDAGFDLLITANNHVLDQGEKGVIRTIEKISENKLNYSGTAKNQNDKDSLRIFDINNIKIAVLAYTENTNGIPVPKGKDYLINIVDSLRIKKDIEKARTFGADIVIVQFHFGVEYKREPNKYQQDIVEKTILAGADIIIGSHPHVIQPLKYFKTINGNIDTGLIAYSLGNFISNQRWRYSDAGIILNIEIAKNLKRDSFYILKVSYLPTWVFRGETDKGKEYIILPADTSGKNSTFNFLYATDKKLMIEAFEDTKESITKYTGNIELTVPFNLVKKYNGKYYFWIR